MIRQKGIRPFKPSECVNCEPKTVFESFTDELTVVVA